MKPTLEALAIAALTYFVVLNAIYVFFTAIAWRKRRGLGTPPAAEQS